MDKWLFLIPKIHFIESNSQPELHLKELAKDIFEIIDKAQLLSTADLNPNSPNYESKVRRGVTGYKYYKLFHKGLNLRLNTEVINGEEQVYSLNIIK